LKKRIFEEAEHNENGETKFKRRKLLPPSEEDINSQKQSFTPLAIDFTENYHTTMKPTMCEDVISPFSSRNTFEDTVSDLRFIKSKGNVQWNGVAGLHVAKKILVEAILLPRRFPSLFAVLMKTLKFCFHHHKRDSFSLLAPERHYWQK